MNNWQQTLADLQSLAREYEDRDWQVISFPVDHIGVVSPTEQADQWGLLPIIPGDAADAIQSLETINSFTEFAVFRQQADQWVYLVVQYRDPDQQRLIQFGGALEADRLGQLRSHAAQADHLPVSLRRLSGEYIASFTHDSWQPFFDTA